MKGACLRYARTPSAPSLRFASNHSYLLLINWFNFCSQIIVAKHNLTQWIIKSCLLKISPIDISVNRIPLLGVLLWILLIIMYLPIHKIDFTFNVWTKNTGIIILQHIYIVKNSFKLFKSSYFVGTSNSWEYVIFSH